MVNRIYEYCLFYILFYLLLFSPVIKAVEEISFNVDEIISKQWKIKNVELSLTKLENKKKQFRASIKQLMLPKPFSNVQFVDITCQDFTWQQNEINCQKGKAKLKSDIVDSFPFEFSFFISEKESRFSFQNLAIAKGKLSFTAQEKRGKWLVLIRSKNIQLKLLAPYIKEQQASLDEITNGLISADIKLTGNDNQINTLSLESLFKNISFQAEQGNIAVEALDFEINLFASNKNGKWTWENNNQLLKGEIYKDPLYIEIKEEKGINIQTKGIWREDGAIDIRQANLMLPGVLKINAEVILKYRHVFKIDSSTIDININDLDYFSTHYLSPVTEQTVLDGLKFKGKLVSKIEVSNAKISQVSSQLSDFTLHDDKQRIVLIESNGELNWSNNPNFSTPSSINWKQLKIRAIPFDAGQLTFLLSDKKIALVQKSSIPILEGEFTINQFNLKYGKNMEPIVYFDGGIKNLSLERLSQVLDWTPLAGNISGNIPGVEYTNKVLKLNGALNVGVFDGNIKINKLASSGLFTDFPKLYMDMNINNLDLNTLTQKFEMGGIEGRLSGYINNLYLENWAPVTFYAWFGTPENDDSRHRISQKAVENIASIGGGGAADAISKGFLRFFDTFGYDRLGFGCYLHQGVCQLMGVEAAEQGYYIIKGGGLPRIDVIGFNPRVDWKVLMRRLSRISKTDNLIIE
ncbi:MAG: C4-dicarboxylate ABC transporter [Methylococcaceae bacterium]|nr:C4-dicarboxylate ABC transporter [Methylococcaceae bacterium]